MDPLTDIRLSAFFDELEKIAEVNGQPKASGFKRWAKNTALIGAGTAAGYGSAMVAEHSAGKIFGERFRKWNSPGKSRLIRAGTGLMGAAAFVAGENLLRQRQKAEQGG